MRQRQILAGAVREIGSDLRISPYLSNTSQPTLGSRCGGLIRLPRVYRDIVRAIPVQIANRHFDISFGCYVFGLESLAFQ